ncbi:MAG: class I SAM-dependent methyltransferase [Longimicrobiales bacterium]|nr:class I SAM-dependent methyltransferase [Longimicrobiales bacterium]
MTDNPRDVKEFWDEKYASFNVNEEVEGDLDLANQNINLKGKRVLIVAVGTGKEVVKAARAGAQVYGIDISSNAVRNAQEMLIANLLSGTMVVGDAAKTSFDTNFFDVIWGSSVLHHLDHEKYAKELDRILKDDGAAIFVDEATFFNPLFKYTYEKLFGKGRVGRRRKRWIFKRRGDDFEKPIEEADLTNYEGQFVIESIPCKFMFFEKIAHVVFPGNGKMYALVGRIDSFLHYLLPSIKKYSYEYNFIFTKKKKVDN